MIVRVRYYGMDSKSNKDRTVLDILTQQPRITAALITVCPKSHMNIVSSTVFVSPDYHPNRLLLVICVCIYHIIVLFSSYIADDKF